MTVATPQAVVIGASAGALDALSAILPALPADFRFPVMVVVHIPPDKQSVLAELLQAKCKIQVCEAADKQPLQGGMVYFAPPDYHLLIEENGLLSLSSDEPVLFSRPSIDVLFESAADVYEDGLIGIVLTGANSDGANGLATIAANGGVAIVQDPSSAHNSIMPEAALKAVPAALIMGAKQIAEYLGKVNMT